MGVNFMESSSFYNHVKDIHKWLNYSPKESHYAKYSTNIIFSGIKIVDLYFSLCAARANLYYFELDDYGDMTSCDEVSMLYTKSGFIQNALIYYNVSVDLSWQILWAYYNDTIKYLLPTDGLYQKTLESCTYQELLLGLTLRQDRKMREYVKSFFDKNQSFQKIRYKYNYLKHRGTYYVPGLGLNDNQQMYHFAMEPKFFYDKKLPYMEKLVIPMVSRKQLDLVDEKELLVKFDGEFIDYCEYLFHILMPRDYLDASCSLEQLANFPLKHLGAVIEYNINLKDKKL